MKTLTVITSALFMAMTFIDVGFASETGRRGRERAWRRIQRTPIDVVKSRELREKEIKEQQARELRNRELWQLEVDLYQAQGNLARTVKNERKAGTKVPWVYMYECKVWWEPNNMDTWNGTGLPHYGQVLIQPTFVNLTDWELVGIRFRIDYRDGFGDILYSAEYKLQIKIKPWDSETANGHWIYENNPYIDEEPYDKLWSAVNAKTLIAKATIEKIAWANGQVTGNFPLEKKKAEKKK